MRPFSCNYCTSCCGFVCVSFWQRVGVKTLHSHAFSFPSYIRRPHIPTLFYPYNAPCIALTSTPTCEDGLTFIDDVTVPDFSLIATGSLLDKQWLVQNSGSCNWDNRYRLRMVNGNALGAPLEQSLYPARAGMQATLRIVFIAPMVQGEYYSEWQAFNSQGIPFGDTFFIKIIVQ